MRVAKKFVEKKEYDIPNGIFLKAEYGDWYYGVMADDLLLEVSADRIVTQNAFSEYDNPLDLVQVTRTEFQKAFGDAFRAMQKYHAMIQASPEKIEVKDLNFKTVEEI